MNEILEGNKLIAEFMGGIVEKFTWRKYEPMGVTFDKQVHGLQAHVLEDLNYHTSWDWLMPACQRWDNTWHDEWNAHQVEKYTSLSDELDHFATLYEIEPLWRQLVINIKWYNQNKTS